MTAAGNSDRYDEFVDLFSGHAQRLYSYIYAMLPRWADADDVFQETSRVLWQKFGEYRSGTRFFAWASQIARYQVLFFRQRRQRSRITFTDAFVDVVAATASEQSDWLEAERRALAECVEKLGARDRDIILSRFAPEATTKTVAVRMGMSRDAVYKSLGRIQAKLLACIEETIARPEERP